MGYALANAGSADKWRHRQKSEAQSGQSLHSGVYGQAGGAQSRQGRTSRSSAQAAGMAT